MKLKAMLRHVLFGAFLGATGFAAAQIIPTLPVTLVNNTLATDWTDTSTVMRWSIGLDRPTWIKWLNKDRTFFLSMQIFDTWYWDHEGDNHNGYFTDEHNFITTFFYIANYMRDTLKPVGFVVWEEASNSWVAGQSLEWLIDNHWSIKGGFNIIWGGTNNFRHDAGPFRSFVVPGASGNDPYNPQPCAGCLAMDSGDKAVPKAMSVASSRNFTMMGSA